MVDVGTSDESECIGTCYIEKTTDFLPLSRNIFNCVLLEPIRFSCFFVPNREGYGFYDYVGLNVGCC